MKVKVHWVVLGIEDNYVRCCSVWKDEDSARKDAKSYKDMFPEYAVVERYDVIKIEIKEKSFWSKIIALRKNIGQSING